MKELELEFEHLLRMNGSEELIRAWFALKCEILITMIDADKHINLLNQRIMAQENKQ